MKGGSAAQDKDVPNMNSTTSLPLPARTNDTASITQMSENIFTRPKGQEIMATEVTTTVQAWLNSSQPDLVEDDPAATPFEEGLEFDRLSIGSIPDEEGPIDSPDVGSAGSQHHHSADTSVRYIVVFSVTLFNMTSLD
jgi:hypothetical protein